MCSVIAILLYPLICRILLIPIIFRGLYGPIVYFHTTAERLAFWLMSGKGNRKRSGHAANLLSGSGWFTKVKKRLVMVSIGS